MKNETNSKRELFTSLIDKIIDMDKPEWLRSPFNSEGKTIIANGTFLIAMPLQGEYEDHSEKIKHVYPTLHNINKTILLSEIKDKLKDFHKVDCYDEIESKCDACDGGGEVTFEFDHNHASYELEGDCPVCDGSGKILTESEIPNGKKEYDTSMYLMIGCSAFNVNRIEELLFIAESLNADKIIVANQTKPNKAILFTIDDVDVLLMPCTFEEGQISQTIELK